MAFDLVNKKGKKYHGRFFILIGMHPRHRISRPSKTSLAQVHSSPIEINNSDTLSPYSASEVHSDIIHLGLKISKKMGKAVTRNKIRRRLKSLIRSSLKTIEPTRWHDWAFVIIPRKGIDEAEYSSLEIDILNNINRALSVNT